MKRVLFAMAASILSLSTMAADVGVSISVGQPGFYGRIDIGDFPRPQLIYPKPVVIAPPAVVVREPPLYLHVPPGHAKNWRKYCGRYNACGRSVYFVQESWYNDVYVPRHRERHRDRYDGSRYAPASPAPQAVRAPGPGYGPSPGPDRYDRRDEDRDDQRDRGNGHSKGKGHKDD